MQQFKADPVLRIDADMFIIELYNTLIFSYRIKKLYQSLLPNPLLFWTELVVYKSNLEMRGSKEIPTNLDDALQEINPSIFPNLFTMLKIVKTLPVSSCEAERSFSTFRRLNTWLRSSMWNSRLSNLARIHIHRDRAQCLPCQEIKLSRFL